MDDSVYENPIIVSADGTIEIKQCKIIVETNGTISGSSSSTVELTIPYGVTYSISDNKITFDQMDEYEYLRVLGIEVPTQYYKVINSATGEYDYFDLLTESGYYEGASVTVIKPEDEERLHYDNVANWSVKSGKITGDTTIRATFGTASIYYVTIETNAKNAEGGSITVKVYGNSVPSIAGETIAGDILNGVNSASYKTEGNVITFTNDYGVVEQITLIKPDDTKLIRYDEFATWDPTEGKISSDTTIEAIFGDSAQRHTVTIKTNGTIKDTEETSKSLEFPFGITYQVYDNLILFSDNRTIEVVKPDDDDRHKYDEFATWSRTTGSIIKSIDIDAIFNYTPIYTVTIKTNDEITETFNVLKGTTYSVNTEDNTVTFVYDAEVVKVVEVTKPEDDNRHKYNDNATWVDESGIISDDTTLKATFGYVPKYEVNVETRTVCDTTEIVIDKKTVYILFNTEYSTVGNIITFSDEESTSIEVTKPDDNVQWWYPEVVSSWDPDTGKITRDITIAAKFIGTLQEYKVTITAENGSIDEYGETSKELTVKYGTTYALDSSDKNTIIFSDEQIVIAIKPDDDDEHKYNEYTTWYPNVESGTIVGDTTIKSNFGYIPKYVVTVYAGNGTIDATNEQSKSLIVLSGTTYTTYVTSTKDNYIRFTYGDEIVDTIEVRKFQDTEKWIYAEVATWDPASSGTITAKTDITGTFAGKIKEYLVSIKTNGTGSKKIYIPYETTYWIDTENKNTIKFSDEHEVTVIKPTDEGYKKYETYATWVPESGVILRDTEINATFALKRTIFGDTLEIEDKYTSELSAEERVGLLGRIMRLEVTSIYDEISETEGRYLIYWKLSVFDRYYIDAQGHYKDRPTSEDGLWYTTGPTIVTINGEQRYFHVQTGNTEGEIEGLNDYPSLPGYVEGEFYLDGDENGVCDPVPYSLTTFIGGYTKAERDEISEKIILGKPVDNYKSATIEMSYPPGFDKSRTITVVKGDDYIESVSGSGTYTYGDTVVISATIKDDTHLFSHWNDSNTENPRTIEKVMYNATYTAYSTEVYGVKKNNSINNSIWTRTNASKGLIANATHDGSAVINNFDAIYPWSDIMTYNIDTDGNQKCSINDSKFSFDGSNGDVMTYIPKHYLKRYVEDGEERIQIAKDIFDGATEIEPFYVGRYPMSDDVMSKSGVFGQVNKKIDEFRKEITSTKGDNWSQLDWRLFVIQNLYLVEYATGESQEALGYGISKVPAWITNSTVFKHWEQWTGWTEDKTTLLPFVYKSIYDKEGRLINYFRIPPDAKSYQVANGECDELGMRSGCLVNDGTHSVIYRGIENPFGNTWYFLDGVNIRDFKIFVSFDHDKYKSGYYKKPYKRLSYLASTTEGSPIENGYDSLYPLISIPSACEGTKTDGYYWRETGDRIVIVGGHWYNNTLGEIFTMTTNYTPNTSRFDIGARLMCDYNEVDEDEEE